MILSSQFAAVVVGNLLWGAMCDRWGSARVLQVTMLGDALTFAASGFCRSVVLLVVVSTSQSRLSRNLLDVLTSYSDPQPRCVRLRV